MLCLVQAGAQNIRWPFLKDESTPMKNLLDSQSTWLITLGAYIFFIYGEVYLFDVITMAKNALFPTVSSSQN